MARRSAPGTDAAGPLRAAFWLFAAVVVMAPLPLASVKPWSEAAIAIGLGIASVLWALAALRSPTAVAVPWRVLVPAALPFGLVIGWALLQVASFTPPAWHHPLWQESAAALGRPVAGSITLDRDDTWRAIARALSLAVAFFLAVQLGRDEGRARRLVWLVALAASAYAAYGIGAHFLGGSRVLWFAKDSYWRSVTGPFVGANAFAVYAGVGLIAALGLLVRRATRIMPGRLWSRGGLLEFADGLTPALFFLAMLCATLASALLLSLSRGGLGSAALGVVVLFAALALSRGEPASGHDGQRRTILWLAGLTFLAALALLSVSGEATLGRIAGTIGGGPTGREDIHALTMRVIAETPWKGAGYGTFERLFFMARDGAFPWDTTRYDRAHSTYLELAAELGLAGAGLLLVAIGWLVAVCLRGARVRRRASCYPAIALGATALVGSQAAFDFAIQVPAVALSYFTLLGVGFAQSLRDAELAPVAPAHPSPRRVYRRLR